MKDKKFITFIVIMAMFNLAASLVHPVTPTFIVERQLDSSMFGVALAAQMTMNFCFSPFWGKVCNYLNAKTVMLICSLGYAVGQLIFCLAYSEAIVVAGRMFAGVFVGGCFISFSNYIISLSTSSKDRGQKLTIMATTQSVMSACGYFAGGMLGLISVEAAFIAQIAILSLCGILFFVTGAKNHDDQVEVKPMNIKDVNPFKSFLDAKDFMTEMLALVFIIVAIGAIGQNSYEQCFNYYIKDQFGMSSAYNGVFKAAIAILTLVLNSTVCLQLQKKTDINKTFIYILGALTIITGTIVFVDSKMVFVGGYIIYSGVNAIRLPLMQSITANMADKNNSNAVMGFYQAMNSLGGIFGALFAGLIYETGARLPFILALIAFALTTVIGAVYINKYKKLENK